MINFLIYILIGCVFCGVALGFSEWEEHERGAVAMIATLMVIFWPFALALGMMLFIPMMISRSIKKARKEWKK